MFQDLTLYETVIYFWHPPGQNKTKICLSFPFEVLFLNFLFWLGPFHCTKFVGRWVHCDPNHTCQVQLILRHPWWRSETEMLQEGAEEEEEFHPGQAFTQAYPASWKQKGSSSVQCLPLIGLLKRWVFPTLLMWDHTRYYMLTKRIPWFLVCLFI